MRRLLALIVAVVVPLKALALVAVPPADTSRAGSPATHHVGPDGHAPAADAAAAAGHECPHEHGSVPHAVECHHLTMPLLSGAAPALEVLAARSGPHASAPEPLVSIVLDVLHPPPLARS